MPDLTRMIHKCYRTLACSFVCNEFFVSRPYAWLRLSWQSIRCDTCGLAHKKVKDRLGERKVARRVKVEGPNQSPR